MKFNVDDLVEKGLVSKKSYIEGNYSGLSILKYKNKVFWDNLWDTDKRLLDCRGMVVDAEDNVVIWPFTKIFNRFENGTDLPLDQTVKCIRKVNGFMAAASIYNNEWIVSTTGTLDSHYANLAKSLISLDNYPLLKLSKTWNNMTFIFEICDSSDQHIVKEEPGVYLIGIRNHLNGEMLPEEALDILCLDHWKRPTWEVIHFNEVIKKSKEVCHEGFVIRSILSGDLLLKIKSPHYLAKKFLMRGGDSKWDMIWDNPQEANKRVDEEYYSLLEWLRFAFEKEEWKSLDSQLRREKIESYFERDN